METHKKRGTKFGKSSFILKHKTQEKRWLVELYESAKKIVARVWAGHIGGKALFEEAANPWRAKCNRRSGEARGWGGDQNIARAVPISIAMMFLWD
ncbi:hypothetical protein niasHT_019268 [Heterodera trifolii]|uniref:Uncharacterized protein n=1 Tax=Heterodera trifolii TaxID=157864 RepID=A0ABD2L0T2_9BILA